MAILLLDRDGASMERRSAATCSLRAWLNDDWALLFSHSDDFAQHDVEADRWLVLLHDAFAAAGVRPIALGSSSSAGASGWLTQVNAHSARVSLAEHPLPQVADLQLRTLREAIERSSSPFVMMIDEDLRLRRTFEYSAHNRRPSLFDFIATAAKVRSGPAKRPAHYAAPMRRSDLRSSRDVVPTRVHARSLRSCAR
jgi:hypothetical protein